MDAAAESTVVRPVLQPTLVPDWVLAPASDAVRSARVVRRERWVLPSIVVGMTFAATLRQGAFWRLDAFAIAVGSMAVLVVCLRGSRRSVPLPPVVAVLALALWWLVRSILLGAGGDFLPLGASMLAFLAAYATMSGLSEDGRRYGAMGIAALGSMVSVIGFVGTTFRIFPIAIPSQNLWRLASPLTYSDAAGMLLAMTLVVALATDESKWFLRIATFLCIAGLVATQSRGAVLGAACALPFVPWHRIRAYSWPLFLGVGAGLCVVGSSSVTSNPHLGGLAVVAGGLLSALITSRHGRSERRWTQRQKFSVVLAGVVVVCVGGILLHGPIAKRVELASTGDRVAEWSAALDQFSSSPLIGVGPDQLLLVHAKDGSYAHFAHNEYLQVAAGAGFVGISLLLWALAAVARALWRRRDALASCAVGSMVVFTVVGALDFDWHLPAIALAAGWIAGLTGRKQ